MRFNLKRRRKTGPPSPAAKHANLSPRQLTLLRRRIKITIVSPGSSLALRRNELRAALPPPARPPFGRALGPSGQPRLLPPIPPEAGGAPRISEIGVTPVAHVPRQCDKFAAMTNQLFTPITLRDITFDNRVSRPTLVPVQLRRRRPYDSRLMLHLPGLKRVSGAGLVVFEEMTDVEPIGRITPWCAGLVERPPGRSACSR